MKRLYYGWVVCFVSTILIFITMGTVSNGFSIYLPYIMREYGLTHAQTSSLVTLRCLVALFAMLAIGLYYEKLSLRVGTSLAAAFAALAFCLYSLASTYPLFCLGAAISGLSYGFGSMIPVSILMHRWFTAHRALALGVCASGSGIATVVLPPVTTAMVERFSMAATFRLEAMGIFFLTGLIFLLIRDDPTQMGLTPYGETRTADPSPSPSPSQPMTRQLWILLGGVSLCMGAVSNPGFSHLSVLLTSEGFSPMTAAGLISLTGGMITLGKLLYGQTTDRLGGHHASLMFGGLLILGHLLCCLTFLESFPLGVVCALCLGLGYPISTVGPAVWAGELAPPDRYATTLRRLQVIYAGGSLLFANLPGLMADWFHGSYLPAFALLTGLLAVAMLSLSLAYRGGKRRASGGGG